MPEWQTGSRVITFGRIVAIKVQFARSSEWEFAWASLISAVALATHIRNIRKFPHAIEIRFTTRRARNLTCRLCECLRRKRWYKQYGKTSRYEISRHFHF